MFGARAQQLWERVDASERVDLPPGGVLPSTDFFVHVAIWAVVAGLLGLTVWTWRGLAASGLVLAALAGVLELAQGRVTRRGPSRGSDAVANVIGIGVGLAAAAGCLLAWSESRRSPAAGVVTPAHRARDVRLRCEPVRVPGCRRRRAGDGRRRSRGVTDRGRPRSTATSSRSCESALRMSSTALARRRPDPPGSGWRSASAWHRSGRSTPTARRSPRAADR